MRIQFFRATLGRLYPLLAFFLSLLFYLLTLEFELSHLLFIVSRAPVFRSMAAKDAPIQGRSKQRGRSFYNKGSSKKASIQEWRLTFKNISVQDING